MDFGGCQVVSKRQDETLELLDAPPSRAQLKALFVDRFHRIRPAADVNCVAHMILAMDDPREVARIALNHLTDAMGACRGDMGFARPTDKAYVPIAVHYNAETSPPRCDESFYSNQSQVLRRTWREPRPVVCDDVVSHPYLSDCRQEFLAISSKSILFQKLTFQRRPVGLICLDFTHHTHIWTQREQEIISDFTNDFLGPLMAISRHWNRSGGSAAFIRKPSPPELEAIRLAARGMNCEQIARTLDKSPRTIENQIRNARITLQAANRAELIRKCEIWL